MTGLGPRAVQGSRSVRDGNRPDERYFPTGPLGFSPVSPSKKVLSLLTERYLDHEIPPQTPVLSFTHLVERHVVTYV